jgi:hypothetical protein
MYYIITLFFILLAAKGTFFAFYNICWLLMDIVIIWIGIEDKRFHKSDLRVFFYFALVYVAYCSFRSFFFKGLSLSFWANDIIFLFKYILSSFLFCALLRDHTIHYLSKVIIHLAIISVFFYGIQLISGDFIYAIGRTINLPPRPHDKMYVNFVLFTFVKEHAMQNSGFSWEPGAFGFFLNTGLILHLLTTNFAFDKKAKWLALAILTTLSTTAFIGLLVIILMSLRANGVKYSKILFFVAPLLLIAVAELPFLFTKVVSIYHSDEQDIKNIDFLNKYYLQRGINMPLNRFSSMILLNKLFGANLILGVSNLYDESVPLLKNMNISNGIFDFMAKFGLAGLGSMLYSSFLLFKTYTRSIELSMYGILLIVVLGFGECIFVLPLMTCFFFLHYYSAPEEMYVSFSTEDQNYNITILSE